MDSITESAMSVITTVLNVHAPDPNTYKKFTRSSVPRTRKSQHARWSEVMDAVEEEDENRRRSLPTGGTSSYDRSHVISVWRQRLAYTEEDLQKLANTEEDFKEMKEMLRAQKCVTNGYLKQNIHNYVYHMRLRRLQEYQNRAPPTPGPKVQLHNAAA